jgi:hypothetical protein
MTQIDELLRQTANAARRDDYLERKATGAARSALSAAIAAATADDLSKPRYGRQGRREWLPRQATWMVLPMAAAAAAAIVLLVPGGSNIIQPPTAAAAILRRAADAVSVAPTAQLAPGQYWYQEDQATYLDFSTDQSGTMSAYVSEDERWWVNDQHYVRREHLESVRAARPVTNASQRAALALFDGNPDASGTGPGYDMPLSYAQMSQAPSDPNALADFILNITAPAGPTARWRTTVLLEQIGEIVVEPRVPAQMLADLYRLAATLDGVHVIGIVTDELGRQALAIGFTPGDQTTTYELLFDPQTYALLDERETNSTTGQVEENVAYISTGVVSGIGVTPTQQQQPTITTASTTNTSVSTITTSASTVTATTPTDTTPESTTTSSSTTATTGLPG